MSCSDYGFYGVVGNTDDFARLVIAQALCDRYQAQMRPEDVSRKLETKILEIEIIEE